MSIDAPSTCGTNVQRRLYKEEGKDSLTYCPVVVAVAQDMMVHVGIDRKPAAGHTGKAVAGHS